MAIKELLSKYTKNFKKISASSQDDENLLIFKKFYIFFSVLFVIVSIFVSYAYFQKNEHSNLNKRLSVMSQKSELISNLTVIELVRLGRYPHIPAWKFTLSAKDHEAVEYAIDFVGLNQYGYRAIDTLSGGERQRAFLALALAQNGSILFLDEPTNHLDIVSQRQILELLNKLTKEGKIIVTVLHDLNHMAKYATKLALLREGCLFKFGSLETVYTSLNLTTTFGLNIEVVEFNHCRSAIY